MNDKKKALKGLRKLCLWPVTANTEEAYQAGEKIPMPYVQSLTKAVQGQDFTIWADDEIYDTGNEYQYEDLTVGMAELPLEIEAKLSGGEYDTATHTYTFKRTDIPPEFALGYAALRKDNGIRMFKHYAVKLMTVKVDHKSGEGNGDIQPYELTFRNSSRLIDGAVRDTRDDDGMDVSWLDTIDNLPDTTPTP